MVVVVEVVLDVVVEVVVVVIVEVFLDVVVEVPGHSRDCNPTRQYTGSNLESVFRGPMGRCMATKPSSFSLTSNHLS